MRNELLSVSCYINVDMLLPQGYRCIRQIQSPVSGFLGHAFHIQISAIRSLIAVCLYDSVRM